MYHCLNSRVPQILNNTRINYEQNTGKYSDLSLAEKNLSIRTPSRNCFQWLNLSCAHHSEIRQRPCSGLPPDSFYAQVHLYSDNIKFFQVLLYIFARGFVNGWWIYSSWHFNNHIIWYKHRWAEFQTVAKGFFRVLFLQQIPENRPERFLNTSRKLHNYAVCDTSHKITKSDKKHS